MQKRAAVRRPLGLLTDAELVDDRAIAIEVGLLEVVEEPTAAADELEQSAAAVMVLRVGPEVLGQVGDAVREERDLHLRRPGVTLVGGKVRNQFRFLLLGGRQNPVSLDVNR